MHTRTPLVLLVLLMACTPAADDPTALTAELDVAFSTAHERHGEASLSGDEEVPPVDTRAHGIAKLRLSDDGTSIEFFLNVANIVNVTQAHIHRGPAGGIGGIVVWLYPSSPPSQLIPGRSNGRLSSGTITAANLVGSLAGATIADLWAIIQAGGAYVNVHTSANPPGEIRGQVDVKEE